MLTGQAKKDYQRQYMRKYRSNKKAVRPSENVRPKGIEIPKDYKGDESSCSYTGPRRDLAPDGYPAQSDYPMMVGYVPPIPGESNGKK